MDKQTPEKPSNERREMNIDGDVSKSVVISGNGNVVNVGGEKPPKRPRRKTKPRSRKVNWSNPAIIAAVIGAVATIIAALLASPLIGKWIEPDPTPTATSSPPPMEPASATPTESPTATEYVSPTPIVVVVTSTVVTFTASPTASATSTPTPTDTVTPSSTPTPKDSTMTAILQSTDDDGKAPLMVNFDARTSYIKFADGSMVPCGNNPFCSYSFAIYRDSKFVDRISNSTGMLSYTFGAKGKYFVTVYVCRGEVCNDDGVTVTVR